MKKKLWMFAAVLAIAALAFSFVSCGGDDTEYTVTFDAHGGKFADGTAELKVTVKSGKTVDEPAAPVKTAAEFVGWADKEKDGEWYDFKAAVKDDFKLWAVYDDDEGAPQGKPDDPPAYNGKFNAATDKELAMEIDRTNGFGYWSLGGNVGGPGNAAFWYEYLGYGEGEELYEFNYLVIEFNAPNSNEGINLVLSAGWESTVRKQILLNNTSASFFIDWKTNWQLVYDDEADDDNLFVCLASYNVDFKSNIKKVFLTNTKPDGYTELIN